jgi:hypothetical protein
MVRLATRFALLALVLLTAGSFGCTTPRTEVILAVDLDARAEAMVDRLSVEIIDPSGSSRFANAPVSELPRTLGLSWTQGPLGPFTVRVIGERRNLPLITRMARFTFIRSETRVLRVLLTGSCITQVCSASQTCAESGCRDWEIQPSELEPYTGTFSRPDGGLDAGPVDAFVPRVDASPDAFVVPPDAFVVPPDAFVEDPDAFIEPPDAFTTPDAFVGSPDAFIAPDAFGLDACMPRAEVCNNLDDNCNAMVDETFDLTSDRTNCGMCGNVCNLPNASNRCRLSACEIRSCDMSFEDCDRNAMNGCEVNVTSDAANCRVCGNACGGATPVCCRGACAASCP